MTNYLSVFNQSKLDVHKDDLHETKQTDGLVGYDYKDKQFNEVTLGSHLLYTNHILSIDADSIVSSTLTGAPPLNVSNNTISIDSIPEFKALELNWTSTPYIDFKQTGTVDYQNRIIMIGDGKIMRFHVDSSTQADMEISPTGVYVAENISCQNDLTVKGSNINLGTDNATNTILSVYGGVDQEGGEIRLYYGANADNNYEFWRIDSASTNLRFSPNGTDYIRFHESGDISCGAINGTSVNIVGSDGGIELTKQNGTPYIDFKSSYTDDYAQRIINTTPDTLTFSNTGGNILQISATGISLDESKTIITANDLNNISSLDQKVSTTDDVTFNSIDIASYTTFETTFYSEIWGHLSSTTENLYCVRIGHICFVSWTSAIFTTVEAGSSPDLIYADDALNSNFWPPTTIYTPIRVVNGQTETYGRFKITDTGYIVIGAQNNQNFTNTPASYVPAQTVTYFL